MTKVKQVSVSVEDRPGTLAQVAKVLGDAKLNIFAFLTTTSDSAGAVHVLVDNVNKAKKALDSAGFSFTESEVLYVELNNHPEHWGNLRRSSLPRASTSHRAI